MSESITKELRDCIFDCPHLKGVADRIDARLTHELEAKQEEIDGLRSDNADLQARLDASILPPVDIDGARWTGEDVDKPFSLTDGDKATEGLVREIVYDWPREGWWIVDQHDAHYPADRCRHGTLEPPDSQERIDADAEKDACEYFGHGSRGYSCDGCQADGTEAPCNLTMCRDLLRRQRELDGAGERA